mgnify:CR=1 FL=1
MKINSATEQIWTNQSSVKCTVLVMVCEHVIHSGLCFEVKQIQFAPEFHHIIWRKKSFAADTKHSWKTGTRVASLDNQGSTVHLSEKLESVTFTKHLYPNHLVLHRHFVSPTKQDNTSIEKYLSPLLLVNRSNLHF